MQLLLNTVVEYSLSVVYNLSRYYWPEIENLKQWKHVTKYILNKTTDKKTHEDV